MAEALGFFKQANIKPVVFSPATLGRPVRYVVEGTDDIGVSHAPQVVLAAERGAPIVALGSLISRPTMAMIWLPRSNLRDIADLKGKTVGVPGLPFQELFLQSALKRAGLKLGDVRVRRVGYGAVSALAQGKIDALFGGSWNTDGIRLKALGLSPVITRLPALGFPSYDELVVIARSKSVADSPQVYRVFMSALARGIGAAIHHPKMMEEVLEDNVNAGPDRSPRFTEDEVKATLPMLSTNDYMNLDQARRLMGWMLRERMIERIAPASKLFDNEF